MGRRGVPAVVATSSGGARDYHLPGDADVRAWAELLSPFEGNLYLAPKSSCFSKVQKSWRCVTGRPQLTFVKVWLQSGLHYRRVAAGGANTGTASRHGEALPLGGARGFGFFPLLRDEPDCTQHFSVEVCRAQKTFRGGTAGADPWLVKLVAPSSDVEDVTFVATTEMEARRWERQLLMRAAPLTKVWREVPAAAVGAGPSSAAAFAAGTSARRVGALAGAVDKILSTGVSTTVVGVVTSIADNDLFDLATSVGGLAGFAVGVLCTAVRVCVEIRQLPLKAEKLRDDVGRLADALRADLLPKVTKLADTRAEGAEALLTQVGQMSASLDALVGKLLHVALSVKARTREQIKSNDGGTDPSLEAEVAARLQDVRDLQQNLIVVVTWENQRTIGRIDDRSLAKEQADALALVERSHELVAVPPVLDRVVVDWGDSEAPWSKLRDAVLRDPGEAVAGMCACIASTKGMGGVGKTVICQLVAAQAKEEGRRYADGVFWVKLGQGAGEAEAMKGMLAVATVVARKEVAAASVAVAADKLRGVLANKACLIVVDDCWAACLADPFVSAVEGEACRLCCLLMSTRLDGVASMASDQCCVKVGPMAEHRGRDVLLEHSKPRPEPKSQVDEAHLAVLLKAAAGLPLALAVLGSVVRTKGWGWAAAEVHQSFVSQPCPRGGEHSSLWACFQASYKHLDAIGMEPEHCRELYMALCVVEKQEWLPMSALSALWGVDEDVAKVYANLFGDVALATVRPQVQAGKDSLVLGLHDLLVDWIHYGLVLKQNKRQHFYKELVEGYAARLGRGVPPAVGEVSDGQSRPWWALDDEYAKLTVCRHLNAGGDVLRLEAVALLCDWRWIAWHVGRSGLSAVDYRTDCRRSQVALLERIATVVDGAIAVSSTLGVPALQQVAFELAERLRAAALSGDALACHMQRLVRDARHCVARPSVELLGDGGLPMPQEVSTFGCGAHEPHSLITLRDASGRALVVSGGGDGSLQVWDVERGARVAVLEGHTACVVCLCVVDVASGAADVAARCTVRRVVSGSVDGSLRVWDVEGEKCEIGRAHV